LDEDKKTDVPTTTEEMEDDALEDTFPASDPPSTGGSTGPNDPTTTGPKTAH
jgi:hypothetical protein